MAGSDPSAVPDASMLRPLLQRYFSDMRGDPAALRDAIYGVFCAYADAGIHVEHALAAVNAEIDRVTPMVTSSYTALRDLKRVVMTCCLDCYYPDEPRRDSQRVPA